MVQISVILGYGAGLLVVLSFLFQTVKMIRLKSFEQLSYIFALLQLLVNLMWVVYGIHEATPPLYIASSIVMVILIFMIFTKFIFDRRNKKIKIIPVDSIIPIDPI